MVRKMKASTKAEYNEGIALIKEVQAEARRVLKANGGKDIRFTPSGKIIFPVQAVKKTPRE